MAQLLQELIPRPPRYDDYYISIAVRMRLRKGFPAINLAIWYFQVLVEDLLPGVWYEFSVQSVGSYNRINDIESNSVTQQTSMANNIIVLQQTCY